MKFPQLNFILTFEINVYQSFGYEPLYMIQNQPLAKVF